MQYPLRLQPLHSCAAAGAVPRSSGSKQKCRTLENYQQFASGVRPYFIWKTIPVRHSFVVLPSTVVPRAVHLLLVDMPAKQLTTALTQTLLFHPLPPPIVRLCRVPSACAQDIYLCVMFPSNSPWFLHLCLLLFKWKKKVFGTERFSQNFLMLEILKVCMLLNAKSSQTMVGSVMLSSYFCMAFLAVTFFVVVAEREKWVKTYKLNGICIWEIPIPTPCR